MEGTERTRLIYHGRKTITSEELLARLNAGKSKTRILWERLPHTRDQIAYDIKRVGRKLLRTVKRR